MLKKVFFKRWFLRLILFLILIYFTKNIYGSFSPKLPSLGSPAFLYSNQCRQNLRSTVIKAINSAKESIHLVMFGLSDPQIIYTLKNKAASINTKIYYDKRSSKKVDLPGDVIFPMKTTGLMHQKILIIDNKLTFLGSCNFTRSSLSMDNNLIIGIYSPDLARFLSKNTPYKSGYLKKVIGGQKIECFLLPDKNNKALEHLKTHLRSARKSIKIAMFTFTHPILIEELIKAKKRNVEICVVVDFSSGVGISSKYIQKLKEANVKVLLSQGIELLHYKYLIVDDKTLICGSANWTKAAFSKNTDLILTIYNLNGEQKKFMQKLQKIVELQTI